MPVINDQEALKDIFSDALKRYQAGEKRYGRFDPHHDKRDLLSEVEAELLDGINYLGMFLLKLRTLKQGLQAGDK